MDEIIFLMMILIEWIGLGGTLRGWKFTDDPAAGIAIGAVVCFHRQRRIQRWFRRNPCGRPRRRPALRFIQRWFIILIHYIHLFPAPDSIWCELIIGWISNRLFLFRMRSIDAIVGIESNVDWKDWMGFFLFDWINCAGWSLFYDLDIWKCWYIFGASYQTTVAIAMKSEMIRTKKLVSKR